MATFTTDALVIGGGLMGMATMYSLGLRGVTATLVERNAKPGMETTARSGAIIRAHYGVPELVSLALDANRRYFRFADEVGYDCGFVESGYAVIVDESDKPVLHANVEMHRDLGVNVQLLSPWHIGQMVPGINTEDIAMVAYEPHAGYADPAKTVAAYTQRATELGGTMLYSQTVTAAAKTASGWDLVLSSGDTVSAEQVVLCTGNWSRPVGTLFGLDLPVTPVRAQIVVMERPDSMFGKFPVVSDLINLAYFRTDGQRGLWVGSSDMVDLAERLPEPEGYNESVDPSAIDSARRKTAMRFTHMPEEKGLVQRAFSGLYETTPDWQPIIESFDPTLHAAVGFSGHGFKLAPVIGDAMADFVTGTAVRPEIGLFRLGRFADDQPIKSTHYYQRARFLR